MATQLDSIPDHVPPELVFRGDFEQFITARPDPFRRLGELHDGPDILWVKRWSKGMGGGYAGWLLTRKSLMREVLTDTERFVSGGDLLSIIGLDQPLIPLELNPPHQQRYRKVLEPFFAPRAIDALDATIRDTCDRLISGFEGKSSCEFIHDFADKFPTQIFLDLMGMPRDRLQQFLDWERDMLRGDTPEKVVTAMTQIADYLNLFLAEQETNPGSPLMKGIVSARLDDGHALTPQEKLSVAYILYIGGLDTVYSTIGWIFWHLAQDQALQDRLRADPGLIPQASEELLRAFSAASTGRRVKHDTMFHGVPMRAGDTVTALLSLAARDPAAYDDPHRIDIARRPRHIAFGTGPHTCLGIRLAKREVRIVLEEFLTRFGNIRMPAGETHRYHVGSVFGIDYLPLEWDPVR